MKVKWYGHSAFLLTSSKGFKIITDPYEPGGFGGAIGYGQIPDEADVVLVSHDHADHIDIRKSNAICNHHEMPINWAPVV